MDSNVLYANEIFTLEVKSEGSENRYFIKGLISTTDPDKVNDIVTDIAQDDIVEQVKNSPITMDLDHESFRDPKSGEFFDRTKNKIPVAKIVEANRVENGTEVKAELNKNHPMFDKIVKSIQEGFLNSFSIAFVPIKAITKSINGVAHRILDKVSLLNVGITGIPVNSKATFALVTKSFCQEKMSEDKVTKLETQMADLKSDFEGKIKSLEADLKSKDEALEAKETELANLKAEMSEEDKKKKEEEEGKKTEMKSLSEGYDSIKKELSELKSVIENLKTVPVNKGQVEAKSQSSEELNGGALTYL